MKFYHNFHKPLFFTLTLVSSYASVYGMETTCVVPTIIITSAAGSLCCFLKRQCAQTPSLSQHVPPPLIMSSFSATHQSTETESNYESPDSIFKSALTRKNSNPKVLDTVDMGAEPCKK